MSKKLVTTKRGLAILLALIMALSVLPPLDAQAMGGAEQLSGGGESLRYIQSWSTIHGGNSQVEIIGDLSQHNIGGRFVFEFDYLISERTRAWPRPFTNNNDAAQPLFAGLSLFTEPNPGTETRITRMQERVGQMTMHRPSGTLANADSLNPLQTITMGQWHTVRLAIDMEAQIFNYYVMIDGVFRHVNVCYRVGQLPFVDMPLLPGAHGETLSSFKIMLPNANTGTIAIDNINIWANLNESWATITAVDANANSTFTPTGVPCYSEDFQSIDFTVSGIRETTDPYENDFVEVSIPLQTGSPLPWNTPAARTNWMTVPGTGNRFMLVGNTGSNSTNAFGSFVEKTPVNPDLFVPVTGITKTSANTVEAHRALTLAATVTPGHATNDTIVWSVAYDGGTGAVIESNTLIATTAGTVEILATIENGLTETTDFTATFTLIVTPVQAEPHPGAPFSPTAAPIENQPIQPARVNATIVQPQEDGSLVYIPWVTHDSLARGVSGEDPELHRLEGNVLPDFSRVGFRENQEDLPFLTAAGGYYIHTLSPNLVGDDTARINAAITHVGAQPEQASGFRGVVELEAGVFRISGRDGILLNANGVVLRGSGQGPDGTVLAYTHRPGNAVHPTNAHIFRNQATAITMGTNINETFGPNELGYFDAFTFAGAGKDTTLSHSNETAVVAGWYPVGSNTLTLPDGHGFQAGDRISLLRIPSRTHLDLMRLTTPSANWGFPTNNVNNNVGEPQLHYPLDFERVITAVNGNTITLNIPLMQGLNIPTDDTAIVRLIHENERVINVGIENLRIVAVREPGNLMSINRGRTAIRAIAVRDGFIRDTSSVFFPFAHTNIYHHATNISVLNNSYLSPAVVYHSARLYGFTVDHGTNTFFDGNYAQGARYEFVTGAATAGPHVFLDGVGEGSRIGPENHHRWAAGTLFDNIRMIEGNTSILHASGAQNGGRGVIGRFRAEDRGGNGTGHGWTANTSMFWNVMSPDLMITRPPTGQNFVEGTSGIYTNHNWRGQGGNAITNALRAMYGGGAHLMNIQNTVHPGSLFRAQWAYNYSGYYWNAVPNRPLLQRPAPETRVEETFTISGIHDMNAEAVYIYINGVLHGEATLGNATNRHVFSYTVTLTPGYHQIAAAQTVRGMVSHLTAQRSVNVLIAPGVQGTDPSGFVFTSENAATQNMHSIRPDDFFISVVGGTAGVRRAEAGDTVIVTADDRSDEDRTFVRWRARGVILTEAQMTAALLTFTMPASDVTLTALFSGGDGEITIDNPGTDDEVSLPFTVFGTLTTDDFGEVELTVRQGTNTNTVPLEGANFAFEQNQWVNVIAAPLNPNNPGGIGANRPHIVFPEEARVSDGVAVVEFDFVGTAPLENVCNVIIVLAEHGANPNAFGQMPYTIRLNGNHFDAHDGAGFRYVNRVDYVPGLKFTFRVEIDIAAERFNVWMTPEGGEQILLASDFSRRGGSLVTNSIGRILMHNNTTVGNTSLGTDYTVSNIRTAQMELAGWSYEITEETFPFLVPGSDRVEIEAALFNSAGELENMDSISVVLTQAIPPTAPAIFAGNNPNVLRELLEQQDVILKTAGNLGIFAHHSPFVIPEGRTLTVVTTLNVQGNAELIIEGRLVVQEGGRVNNQGGAGGTIVIAPSGGLINNGHVENVTNSTVINYGTIDNRARFEVRAGTTLHNCGLIVEGEGRVRLSIHRNANIIRCVNCEVPD